VALGPQYAGSKVSRKALEDTGDETPSSEDREARESPEAEPFADPEASDMDVDDVDGEIDSDEAFGESDEEKFKDFTFRGSGITIKTNGVSQSRKTAADFMLNSDNEMTGLRSNGHGNSENEGEEQDGTSGLSSDGDGSNGKSDEESIEEGDTPNAEEETSEASEADEDDEESDSDDNEEVVDDEEESRRAELRKIMSEEQKTVAATISQAAKADAEKGNAVKQQRKTFDSLLNVRMRLQKALVASNSMVAVEEKNENDTLPYRAAEEAALRLLNTLDTLRQEMNTASGSAKVGGKRKRTVELDTPSSDIWQNLEDSECTAIKIRQSTLEKWSARVRDVTTLPVSSKLNNTARQQTITDVLQEQLSNLERLIKRTKMPRSCAPVQAKLKITEDPHIYDDADFYQLLLKELVGQRMIDSSSISAPLGDDGKSVAQWTAVKEAKTKKNVDTKASKGRKMRYTVHEKLQNFMAPEDRGSWEQDAIDRFFGTLLGQRMSLGEDDGDEMLSDEGEGAPLAEEALMLFRS
jgi:protein AATF/BFR2